jgi:hypothetical protein
MVKMLEVPFLLFLILARWTLIGVLLLRLFCGASFRFSNQLRLTLCGGSTWRWFSWGSLFGAFPSGCGLSLLCSQCFSGFALLLLFTEKFFFLLTSLSLLTLLNDLRIIVRVGPQRLGWLECFLNHSILLHIFGCGLYLTVEPLNE